MARLRTAVAMLLPWMLFATAPVRYSSPDDMALSADGSRLYVVCGGADEIVVVDRASQAITGRVSVGHLPRGIAVSPDGSRIYVTNSWSDTVSEIDSTALRLTRTLPTG